MDENAIRERAEKFQEIGYAPDVRALADDVLDLLREREQMEKEIRDLHTEVDCRIEHGAESGGHLEYVRERLAAALSVVSAPEAQETLSPEQVARQNDPHYADQGSPPYAPEATKEET